MEPFPPPLCRGLGARADGSGGRPRCPQHPGVPLQLGWARLGQGQWQSYFCLCCRGCCKEASIIDALGIPACPEWHGKQPARWVGQAWGSAEELGPKELRPPAALAPHPVPTSALHRQPQHLGTQSETRDQRAGPGLGCGASLPGTVVLGGRLSKCGPAGESAGRSQPLQAAPRRGDPQKWCGALCVPRVAVSQPASPCFLRGSYS